ncbi:MAG TPA: methyltransferase domain-containing protein, partial [Bacillota bacterium]|nr:methyltransferase domain-containing protein [Bacillota bacterium]
IVYSYHALEHISNYNCALSEMKRVLKSGGLLCLGTPNRSRILGYFGGSSTIKEKIQWNISDVKMKFYGKFKNEFGAHAGYTEKELEAILLTHFSHVENITMSYYQYLYANYNFAIKTLEKSGLYKFVLPSVYFLGSK